METPNTQNQMNNKPMNNEQIPDGFKITQYGAIIESEIDITKFYPTRYSSFSMSWEINKQTDKAVLVNDDTWFPKSKVIIKGTRVIAVERKWYRRMEFKATRHMGF